MLRQKYGAGVQWIGRDGVGKRNYFHEVALADRAFRKLLEGRREEDER